MTLIVTQPLQSRALPANAQVVARFLSLEAVAKHFGAQVAVHPTSLDIKAGEFVTLLGPSGCGKTTLLRMIAGLEQPTSGRILIDGEDVTALKPEHRPFNMVFQSYALFPHLNVFDNVAYGLRAAGMAEPAIAERVKGALTMVGLDKYVQMAVDQLSGGMSQRVALVRAIVNEPKVLLLDEPLAALDLQLRKRMQMELRAIQERIGTTFIHVTHDQEEALVMSDRVVVMQAGRIVQVGPPHDIYHFPRTRFVAEFVGETSLLACRIEAADRDLIDVALTNGARRRFPYYGAAACEPGGAGLVSLRPQHLRLVAPGAGLIDGRISNIVFTGAATDCLVALDSGGQLRVTMAAGEAGQERGERVGVDALAGCGVLVPAEESALGGPV